MNDYTLLIILAVVCCSLVAMLFIYLHYRRLGQIRNRVIMKYIHEQDRLTRELERTRIEKEVIEKMLTTYFSKAVESSSSDTENGSEMK
ncbi:hypothetical protein [Phocaeicola sp.]